MANLCALVHRYVVLLHRNKPPSQHQRSRLSRSFSTSRALNRRHFAFQAHSSKTCFRSLTPMDGCCMMTRSKRDQLASPILSTIRIIVPRYNPKILSLCGDLEQSFGCFAMKWSRIGVIALKFSSFLITWHICSAKFRLFVHIMQEKGDGVVHGVHGGKRKILSQDSIHLLAYSIVPTATCFSPLGSPTNSKPIHFIRMSEGKDVDRTRLGIAVAHVARRTQLRVRLLASGCHTCAAPYIMSTAETWREVVLRCEAVWWSCVESVIKYCKRESVWLTIPIRFGSAPADRRTSAAWTSPCLHEMSSAVTPFCRENLTKGQNGSFCCAYT